MRVGRDGEPVLRYRLSPYDANHMRVGFDGAARIHGAAGARRIYSSHTTWVAYDPGGDGETWDVRDLVAVRQRASALHAARPPNRRPLGTGVPI